MKPRYSFLIKPLFILLDLILLNIVIYFVEDENFLNLEFIAYSSSIWLFMAYINKFYEIKRTTGELKVLTLLFSQLFFFTLSFFAYFTLFREGVVIHNQFVILSIIVGVISVNKYLTFYALKLYRKFGRNYRRVVVIGDNISTNRIIKFFNAESNFGYRYIGYYSNNSSENETYLGGIDEVKNVINFEDPIDEIYCSFDDLDKDKRKELIWFSKSNNINFKLLPKARDIFSKNIELEYYETIPVLNVKELPFERQEVRFVKRIFDVIFSLLVIAFLLSWLYPIIWILIKLESKGPAIFKQQREGLNGKGFNCYKFRSMKVNTESDIKSAQKNDARITKIGSFIRRTSIDELPQFFNVLKGDMSVVGPRPHMTKQSQGFEKQITNYYQRNAVKPGITGLAQVSGYRGEVQIKSDIENRIRLDIFYIEKWSFLLDVKIIIKTVTNVFVGEEKAY